MGIGLDGRAKKRRHMGQRYAKHQMQSGVRVYHQRHYQQAIARWRAALNRLRNAEDRFVTLGYMAQAFCDCSDYESMLHYALQQMELANARHDDFMKSEAFLNLSKAYERLADYGKAVSYGHASLQHPNIDARTPGYAHLGIALAHVGLSQFQTALKAFERAMAVASETGDKLLELQICVGLGMLFTLLRDLSKALIFLRNALSILQLVTADNVHAKYKSAILYQLSVVLRLKGSLADARQVCDEALRLSYQTSSRATYARALASMADINRELGESEAKETITKSWARYEQSFRIMRQIKDRMGETLVLSSMAKSASESRSHYTGQCECQAIQLNRKCLELATMIGCKHAMMKCHLRLQELYGQLEDEEGEEGSAQACVALIQDMELFCNFCGQRYGDRDDSLQALRCSHIFHERCLHKFLAEGENLSCPKCKRKAIIMENLNAQEASASSSAEIDAVTTNTAGGATLRDSEYNEDVDESGLTTSRKKLKLESSVFQQHLIQKEQRRQKQLQQQQQQQENQTTKSQIQIQNGRQRETTAPPIMNNDAKVVSGAPTTHAHAQATIRIPRTTSVPIYGYEQSIATNSRFGDYSLREANRILEDAIESISYSDSSRPSTSKSTVKSIKTTRERPKSFLAESAPASDSALSRAEMQIAAESCTQVFSLSASTSSIAFYPSTSDSHLCPKLTDTEAYNNKDIKRNRRSSYSSTGKIQGQKSSSSIILTNVPRRFSARGDEMRALVLSNLLASNKLAPADYETTLPSTSGINLLPKQLGASGKETKCLMNTSMLFDEHSDAGLLSQSYQPTFQTKDICTFEQKTNKNLANEIEQIKSQPKKKPPPPPRKPCCGGIDAFPPLSDELLNAPPSSLIFPNMLERAMRTVLEENEEVLYGTDADILVDAARNECVVEYSPFRKTSDQATKAANFKNSVINKANFEHISTSNETKTDSPAKPSRSSKEGAPQNDDKPDDAKSFIVRHGAGVTDL